MLGSNVDLDGLRLGDFSLAILHVGQVGEVVAEGGLDIEPARAVEFGTITALVILDVVIDAQVSELVEDLLSKATDFPVANSDFLLFHCVSVFLEVWFSSLSNNIFQRYTPLFR